MRSKAERAVCRRVPKELCRRWRAKRWVCTKGELIAANTKVAFIASCYGRLFRPRGCAQKKGKHCAFPFVVYSFVSGNSLVSDSAMVMMISSELSVFAVGISSSGISRLSPFMILSNSSPVSFSLSKSCPATAWS